MTELDRLLALRRTYLPFLLATAASMAGVPIPFLSVAQFRMAMLVINVAIWATALWALQVDIAAERKQREQQESARDLKGCSEPSPTETTMTCSR